MSDPVLSTNAAPGLLQAWIDAFNAGDVDALSALYHADALLWGTTAGAIIDDPAAVRAYFRGVFDLRPPLSATLGPVVVRQHGDIVVMAGRYDLARCRASARDVFPARFTFTARSTGDGWRIVAHHSSWWASGLPDPSDGAAADPG